VAGWLPRLRLSEGSGMTLVVYAVFYDGSMGRFRDEVELVYLVAVPCRAAL
jgi:hypothetical protein